MSPIQRSGKDGTMNQMRNYFKFLLQNGISSKETDTSEKRQKDCFCFYQNVKIFN